jgi:cbb3-type cytochrome c oxidase subunit III
VSGPRVALAVLALAGLAIGAGCGTVGRAEEGSASQGKQLFSEKCASCHTLADAGAQGRIGPNLDDAFANLRNEEKLGQGFEESTIRDVVRDQIAYPVEDPTTGATGMPADLVTGDDADAVAAYVASVAGLPVQNRGATGAGGAAQATDGKSIFTQSCGSCHTLADAGTSGTIGPNLDEAMPSLELAIDRVTNGKGVMPSFKGQLSEQQIKAVAEYVSKSAGK